MMKKNRLISTVIAGTLAAAIVVGGGTFAYLKDSTETVDNQFKNNFVDVEIKETDATGDGTLTKEYSILPGTTAKKDPTVTYKSSVDSYVFVKVTDTVNTTGKKDVVNYSIVDDWNELAGVAGVYYQAKSATDTTANPDGEDLHVLVGDTVEYVSGYNNENATTSLKGDLTFQAYAIQKIKSENPAGESVDFTPAEAWAAINA